MKLTPEERKVLSKVTSAGGKALWKNKSKEERSIEMSRRRNLGVQRKLNAQKHIENNSLNGS